MLKLGTYKLRFGMTFLILLKGFAKEVIAPHLYLLILLSESLVYAVPI